MWRNSFLFLLFWVSFGQLVAQNAQQKITTKIEKVTVFTSGGQVSRKAKINVPQGKTVFVFTGISPNIDKQSIQIKGEGNFTILSVNHQINYLNEQERRAEITQLEKQITMWLKQQNLEKSMKSVFTQEEAMLLKNQVIGGENVGLKVADLKEAVDFQRNRLTEVLLKQNEIDEKLQRLDSLIRKNQLQLKALNQNKDYSTSEVLVTVTAKEAVSNANFELSYLVQNAGWYATYDLRVKDITNPIDLMFKANVFQSSGEDWKEVKLTISNGNPKESAVAPTLPAWYLRFGYSPTSYELWKQTLGQKSDGIKGKVIFADDNTPIPGATVMVKGTTIGTQTDVDGNYELKLPPNAQTLIVSFIGMETMEQTINANRMDFALVSSAQDLSEVVVTAYGLEGRTAGVSVAKKEKDQSKSIRIRGVSSITSTSLPLDVTTSYQPTTINYEIATPYTILNDGKVYTVEVKNQSVPAYYEYFAVPKLEKDAFLTANLLDWKELNLLEGEVNLFFEGAFLGKSVLNLKNANDTLSISLGRDKSIVVERKKLKEYTKKQFLSSYKTESRAYELIISNNKPQPIQITVLEQFPISTNKQIEVEEQEAAGAVIDKETRQLTWKYELPARQERKHVLRYSVKYPKDATVTVE
ncbi:MAG: DUF4139 domain-containing protein [Thermoflexibacteraceae bacterium]